jgi:ribosomal-protein-alanine N-acetyltransferase
VIAGAQSDRLLGSIGVHWGSAADRRWFIGYWLAPDARGRGIITTAVRLLSEWAFANLPADRLEITVDPANSASRAVAERAGYSFEGVLRSHTLIKGRRRDMAVYSLLRGEPG